MFLTDFPKAALGKQFYLFYDPEALRDSGVSASQGLCADGESRRAGSQGTHTSKVSMAETRGRNPWQSFTGLVSADVCAHGGPEQAPCTEHYLHLCSASNTLLSRTPGEISLHVLFQITIEKAVFLSIFSSAGDSPKPCHSDHRHFQTFLKNVQASLASSPLFPIQSFFPQQDL